MSTIVANNKREEGRSIFIKSNPIVGLLSLTSLVDDSNDPVGDSSFTKSFRYSTNGVTFSDWIPLTAPAIAAVSVEPSDIFIIEVSYEKVGTTNVNLIDVNQATLTVTKDVEEILPYFEQSPFRTYFTRNDQEVVNWYVNLLQKLYNKGVLPNYLDRDENLEDFLAIWSSIAKFFSYYVKLARTVAAFYNNESLLREFLHQRGIQTSSEDTLQQLQHLLETYYQQVGKRGTVKIVEDVNEGAVVNGELKRAIHYNADVDEFMFALFEPQQVGWNIGNSSPLYKGLRVVEGLNKAPWSPGYVSMENAGPYLTAGGSVLIDLAINKPVAALSNSSISINKANPLHNLIKFDPNLDYEISFQIKASATTTLSLFIAGENANGISVSCTSRKTGLASNTFFEDAVLSRSDEYVTVKAYLYNKQRGVFAADSTSIRQGSNLIANATLVKAGLTLSVDGEANVYDFRIVPMHTRFSRGFVQANNFIGTWLKNNNGQWTISQLEDYIEHYLIPYNSKLKVIEIGANLYNDLEEEVDQTYWVGAGEYCQKVAWIGIDPACETTTLVWEPDEDTAYCEQE